ncbi:MAG: hypothetical protein HW380_3995, partial [Magnetococcales bacterium]|nr:hypothetical protein [Magnetococcales bacterium]
TMPKKTQSEVGQSLEIYTNFFHPSVSFSLTGSDVSDIPPISPEMFANALVRPYRPTHPVKSIKNPPMFPIL